MILHERNEWWWRRLNSVARIALARGAFGWATRNLIVNEYPKSGGTWLAQMLAAATGLPFPAHRLPLLRRQVLQGHFLRPEGMSNVVVVWRDGRDVLVSFYYQRIVGNEYSQMRRVEQLRGRLGIEEPEDIRTYLPRFAEYCFTRPRHPRFSWTQFADVWAGRRGVVSTTYEALQRDAASEVGRILGELGYAPLVEAHATDIAARFSFRRQQQEQARASGRQLGRRFLRKGVVGDWRNHFTAETAQVFDRYAGETLIRLGYEADHRWAEPARFSQDIDDGKVGFVA